jgi:hypothetical protein
VGFFVPDLNASIGQTSDVDIHIGPVGRPWSLGVKIGLPKWTCIVETEQTWKTACRTTLWHCSASGLGRGRDSTAVSCQVSPHAVGSPSPPVLPLTLAPTPPKSFPSGLAASGQMEFEGGSLVWCHLSIILSTKVGAVLQKVWRGQLHVSKSVCDSVPKLDSRQSQWCHPRWHLLGLSFVHSWSGDVKDTSCYPWTLPWCVYTVG